MKSICKQCDKEFKFLKSQKRGLFCSRNCSFDYKSIEVMTTTKAGKTAALTYLKRFHTYECSECGISDWNHKPLSLQIDHINGDRNDNSISNLRWLCPNCHTQTPTWGSRNASEESKKRIVEGAIKGNKNSQISQKMRKMANSNLQ